MTFEVRRVGEEELPPFINAVSTAFLDRPDVEKFVAQVRPHWDLERTWAAWDDDRICGTFRSWATELTVPGRGRLPAAAVAAVTVLPTHRRRGVLTAMAAAEHAAMRERGEVVGLLYASEFPIYGRFGYGPACRQATWTLDALGTRFHGRSGGTVELVSPDAAARESIKDVFEAWRFRQAGEIRRRDFQWEYELGRETGWGERWNGFLALHRDSAGTVDGYVRYRAAEKWEHNQPRGTVQVDELHALNDEAYASLWRFLAAIDLVATVTAEGRSPAERLPWLLADARAAVVSDVSDGMWVHLLDVPRALEARTYEREGRIVLELIDPEAAGGRVRVELDAEGDGARCTLTDRAPDLTLHLSAAGAAYLGGTRLRDAVVAHGFDEHRAGAMELADGLFRTADEPWCSTHF